jgi:hypothetical protein
MGLHPLMIPNDCNNAAQVPGQVGLNTTDVGGGAVVTQPIGVSGAGRKLL